MKISRLLLIFRSTIDEILMKIVEKLSLFWRFLSKPFTKSIVFTRQSCRGAQWLSTNMQMIEIPTKIGRVLSIILPATKKFERTLSVKHKMSWTEADWMTRSLRLPHLRSLWSWFQFRNVRWVGKILRGPTKWKTCVGHSECLRFLREGSAYASGCHGNHFTSI